MAQNITLNERKSEEMKWAQSIVSKIDNDPREFVKYRESRPITDVKHMIETSVELYGNNTAFMYKEKGSEAYLSITYKEMLEKINGLGTSLIAKGMKDKRIAVIGENCYQWAISYLAAVCGTGTIVPLDKELSGDDLKNLIMKADVECVIFAKKYEPLFKEMRDSGDTELKVLINFNSQEEKDGVLSWKQVVEEGQAMVANGDNSFTDAEIINDEMRIILFTSGTTGASKGVMLSHKNLAANLMMAPTVLKVYPWDIFFSVLPLHHTYECTCGFLMPLYKGAAIAYCQGLKYILKNLQEAKPTMFLGVPLIFENLYKGIWKNVRKQGKEDLIKRIIKINNKTKKIGIDIGKIFFKPITAVFGGNMRMMICGGAAINPDVLNGIRDFGISAVQGYGLTECSPLGALNPDTAPNPASIGVAFPGGQIKAVDFNEEGIGELCLYGDNVMMGYYQMPEETAEVIDSEGWFHTGDLGYVDDKGYAFITGRKKNVIITKNGKNVYPEELEYLLSNSPYVQESFVFSQDTEHSEDTTIVASIKADRDAVEEKLGKGYTAEDLKKLIWEEVDKVNEDAPFYRKIKKVIIREKDFVKNTSNKLVRFAEENKKEV